MTAEELVRMYQDACRELSRAEEERRQADLRLDKAKRGDGSSSQQVVNHDEAYQLACMKRGESNLARCYLALRDGDDRCCLAESRRDDCPVHGIGFSAARTRLAGLTSSPETATPSRIFETYLAELDCTIEETIAAGHDLVAQATMDTRVGACELWRRLAKESGTESASALTSAPARERPPLDQGVSPGEASTSPGDCYARASGRSDATPDEHVPGSVLADVLRILEVDDPAQWDEWPKRLSEDTRIALGDLFTARRNRERAKTTATDASSVAQPEEDDMRATGEKPGLVGRASGMAGSCPDANPSSESPIFETRVSATSPGGAEMQGDDPGPGSPNASQAVANRAAHAESCPYFVGESWCNCAMSHGEGPSAGDGCPTVTVALHLLCNTCQDIAAPRTSHTGKVDKG